MTRVSGVTDVPEDSGASESTPTERSAQGAMTLPAEYYCSEEIWREEVEKIFSRQWLYTGHVSQLADPGSYYLWNLGTDSVIVLCDKDGEIRAFHNVCRHRGSRLCKETSGNLPGAIQCPYHAWTYALDGRLKAAPNMHEREGFAEADYSLHGVAAAVWEGCIFINLASDPEPFERAMAPLMSRFARWNIADLHSAHQTVYDVEANWKLFFQNYSECYHCPTVHPLLNKLTPYRDTANDLEDGPVLGGPMWLSSGGGSMSMTGETCGPPLAGLSGDDLKSVYYYILFPSMFLSLHPDYVLIHRGVPSGPAQTRIYCDWYFHPDAIAGPGFDPGPSVEFWDMTNQQDWDLCTISQQGISSRAYRPGPYSELESQLAAFDREYLNVMGRETP